MVPDSQPSTEGSTRKPRTELSPDQRATLYRKRQEGKSYSTIATEENLKRSTVVSAIKNVRERQTTQTSKRAGRPRKYNSEQESKRARAERNRARRSIASGNTDHSPKHRSPRVSQRPKRRTAAMASDLDLDQIYQFALQLGKDAGKLLLDAAQKRMSGDVQLEEEEKLNSVDIVTKTDEEVESFIRESILAKYPSHKFVGEESYSKGSSKEYLIDDSPTWCIDPLDGTVNFAHLSPFYCVSIGFVVNGKPVIGVVDAPFLRQTFSACQGKGAWLNETQRLPLLRNPIPPLPANAPKGCIFSCEWGKDRRDIPDGNLHRKVESFINMATEIGGRDGKGGMVHGVRSLGSATLDLAYCAMGSFDIWWEGGCWEWDVCAGICLLEEAGGLITTANPPEDPQTAAIEPAKLGGRLYLAVRPAGDKEGESGRAGQERTVREVWRRVHHLDYARPGA